MKKSFVKITTSMAWPAIFCFLVAATLAADVPPLSEARVSQVIQDVRMLPSNAAARPAVVNDKVTAGTAVRTGGQSRAELTFTDLTITRLGANSVFSFNAGARQIDLAHGSILLEVPSKAPAVKINTVAVTAAITGGTALFGTGPPVKFMVLEGIGTFYPIGHPEQAVTLHGGEMVMLTADGHITEVQKFDVETVLETSPLITDFPDLANLPLILQVIDQQQVDQLAATTSSSPPPSQDIIDVISQNVVANPAISTTPPPAPTLPVISSPNPYVISSGTVITTTTNPSITTNGVTDSGQIYHGPAIDGPFSAWAFGSTSAFDTSISLDSLINVSGAVFKFQALELTGDPTIDITNGETNLGLIAVDSITSGGPGGTLTFAGISGLLLATQNGPITLGPEISFSGMQQLVLYARGSTSDLTLGSNIAVSQTALLAAQHDMIVTSDIQAPKIGLLAGNNLSIDQLNTSVTVADTSGNVDLIAGNDITSSGGLFVARFNGGITSGLNITIDAGHDLISDTLDFFVDSSGLSDGGNISVTAGNNITTTGGIFLFTGGSGAGTATGADVTLQAGGGISASEIATSTGATNGLSLTGSADTNILAGGNIEVGGPISLELTFFSGGSIQTGGNINLSAGGNLDILTDLSAEIDGSSGGNIGTGGNFWVTVGGTLTAGGSISPVIDISLGGSIGTGGNITFQTGGDFSANSFQPVIDTDTNGSIGTGGNISLTVGGNASVTTIEPVVDNDTNGNIGTGGNISLTVTGSLTSSSVSLNIDNSIGGHIGTGGDIYLTTGGDFTTTGGGINFTLQNTTGTIDNGGNITLNVGGNLSTQGLSLILQNYDFSTNTAGSIGTGGNLSATVGGNLAADYVDMFINNRSGGVIGSGDNLTLTVNGALTTTGDAGFIIETRFDSHINGSTVGSTIGSNVTLEVSAASVDIGGSLAGTFFNPGLPFSGISNRGSTIDGSASYIWNVSGDMTVQGDADMEILNDGNAVSDIRPGGTIHGNATLQVIANNFTANSLFAQIDNRNGGVIDSNATLTFNLSGNFATPGTNPGNAFVLPGDAVFYIQNKQNSFGTAGGSIGGAAMLSLNAADMSVAGDFDAEIQNQRGFQSPGSSGGSIGTDAMLNITATSLSVGGELDVLIVNRNNGSGSGTGGNVQGNAAINLNISGNLTATGSDLNSSGTPGDAYFQISNESLVSGSPGGFIGSDATINLQAGSISTAGLLDVEIDNLGGGTIGGNAVISMDVSGDINIQNDATFDIDNGSGSGGGKIGSDAVANVSASNLSAGYLESIIFNQGGNIGGSATVNFNVSGNLTSTQSDEVFIITNRNGGTIGSNATIDVTAASISTAGFLNPVINNNAAGVIHGNATNAVDATGDINATGGFYFVIADTGFQNTDNTYTGGRIDGNATVILQGQNIITPSTASGTPGVDTMALEAAIYTNVNGVVGGDAIVNVTALQDISAGGTALFWVANGNYQNLGIGTIGGNAEVNVNAANISTGDFFLLIENFGGSSIGEAASLTLQTGTFSSSGMLQTIINNSGGSIGGDATVQVGTTGNLTANSLLVQIDDTNGGSIGGNATINMNVGGTATVTNDATVQILGNDPTGSAAINFNGGSYDVGGTFLNTIDGDGAITFSNANVHADVVKVGVFGPNGTLMIGGGSISANTLLKLYATGSSGSIDFVANVTLNSASTAVIIAANKVTIFDGVVVTIAGAFPASVYTNIANYTGSGGNGSTTGMFAGNGATTSSLSGAPSFDPPASPTTGTASASTSVKSSSSTQVASSGSVNAASGGGRQSPSQSDVSLAAARKATSGKATTSSTINVSDSGQLLSLLDSATPGSGGKITIPASKSGASLHTSSRINAAGNLKLDRAVADIQNSGKRTVAAIERAELPLK